MWLAAAVGAAAACVPTAARKNARVEPGVDVDVTGGFQYILAGEDESGATTEVEEVPHVELDTQVAGDFSGGSAFAVQLKVPSTIVYTSLDLYYQLAPLDARTYLGFGVELGAAPGGYACYTRYMSPSSFLTFTGRVLTSGSGGALLNPQLAIGHTGTGMELAVFATYAHDTGRGIDIDIDLFTDEDHKDYRKQFALVGVSLRL